VEDLLSCNEEGENIVIMGSDSDTGSQKSDKHANEAQASKKQSKKEKGKNKNKSQNKAKLKKEARELRLASLSEGLEDVTFCGLGRNVEGDIETGNSEMEESVNIAHNGFVNGGSIKKSKVYKRKADESEHNSMTNKKIR
jgi:hypothetical protein